MASIATWMGDGDLNRSCPVARTNKLRHRYEAAMLQRGVSTQRIQGLGFDRMVIAGADKGQLRWKTLLRSVRRSSWSGPCSTSPSGTRNAAC